MRDFCVTLYGIVERRPANIATGCRHKLLKTLGRHAAESGYEPGGRGFESCRARQNIKRLGVSASTRFFFEWGPPSLQHPAQSS